MPAWTTQVQDQPSKLSQNESLKKKKKQPGFVGQW